MKLEEAIKHCLEVAEKNDGEAEVYDLLAKNHNNPYEKLTASRFYADCAECAADHRQLAEWLRELKEAKRLLKAAVDAIYELLDCGATCSGRYCDKYCVYSCETCPLNEAEGMTTCDEWRKWKHADEALALIGEEANHENPT